MKIDRRKFLKMAGFTGIGLGLSAADIFVKDTAEASSGHSAVSTAAVRHAMVIDVRKFKTPEDYQKITEACHSIHNVPTLIPEKGNIRHEIKWIWNVPYGQAFPDQVNHYHPEAFKQKQFPLLCNHCDHPPCVRVCPTKATFKRPDGIVQQDMHRCIGCRFCMAACPFGARSFNFVDPRPFIPARNSEYPTRTMGVVEKCTFCSERLERGLQPACVEASNGAMAFGNLNDPESEVRKILKTSFSLQRKPELGTMPSVFYVIGGEEYAG
ncbi:MAG: 4Fe-4S dicluster domain-containing protein [Nitrospirae bacterium]|nr:4Fe-4S dicluster domain-containing protein [Nitrospirota bacterium]